MDGLDIDFGSVTWERYRVWLAGELFDAYKALSNTKMTIDQLRVLQGRASAYTQMLELGGQNAALRPLDTKG